MAFAKGKAFVILNRMAESNSEASKLLGDLKTIEQSQFEQRFGALLKSNPEFSEESTSKQTTSNNNKPVESATPIKQLKQRETPKFVKQSKNSDYAKSLQKDLGVKLADFRWTDREEVEKYTEALYDVNDVIPDLVNNLNYFGGKRSVIDAFNEEIKNFDKFTKSFNEKDKRKKKFTRDDMKSELGKQLVDLYVTKRTEGKTMYDDYKEINTALVIMEELTSYGTLTSESLQGAVHISVGGRPGQILDNFVGVIYNDEVFFQERWQQRAKEQVSNSKWLNKAMELDPAKVMIYHELGHTLEKQLMKKVGYSTDEVMRNSILDNDKYKPLIDNVLNKYRLDYKEARLTQLQYKIDLDKHPNLNDNAYLDKMTIVKYLSQYATTNKSEFIAEAFAEYVYRKKHNTKPNEFVNDVMKQILSIGGMEV
jgi:hypothetical protein